MIYELSGRPTGKRVLVMPEEAEEWYKGVIIIPETAKEIPVKGRVIQTGFEVIACKPGDEVLYGNYAGNFVDFDITDPDNPDERISKKFLLMLESDVTYVWPCEYVEEKKPDEEIDTALIEKVQQGRKELEQY